ncbi:YmzC family protein [Paenibacillus sp. 102]|uniref:YmzC family protein n=1 Tax=Paenibacillus sp. 102 TaxID=3120823 RepID=UPI0031BA7014
MGEHPISKELRYMRICFVILLVVLIFFNKERVIEVSTNHDSSPVDISTSTMTQIAENTFVLQESNPDSGDRHTIKIFKYDPGTNKIILVKEFNTENPSTYEYQLNKVE